MSLCREQNRHTAFCDFLTAVSTARHGGSIPELEHLLEVKNLEVTFVGDYGASAAVDHISYHVDPGETVCIVGESGCGKSVSSQIGRAHV